SSTGSSSTTITTFTRLAPSCCAGSGACRTRAPPTGARSSSCTPRPSEACCGASSPSSTHSRGERARATLPSMRTGELGFWWRGLGGAPAPRDPLPDSTEGDVAIVGVGYTGRWTAYYLKRAQPSLHVVVLEAERAGYGASGRNGGWATGFFSGPPRRYERNGGRAGFLGLQREMFETVEEIARVLAREGIEADYAKGGQLTVALDDAQARRRREHVRQLRELGVSADDLHELGAEELAARVSVAGARTATFSPHAARLHPAKLVVGLTAAAERLGVKIYEQT